MGNIELAYTLSYLPISPASRTAQYIVRVSEGVVSIENRPSRELPDKFGIRIAEDLASEGVTFDEPSLKRYFPNLRLTRSAPSTSITTSHE